MRKSLPLRCWGLYPLSNQNLLRDLDALVAGEPVRGPIASFLDAKAEFVATTTVTKTQSMQSSVGLESHVGVGDDRVITDVDPCQRRAVMLARSASGLVLHGPPGTGKSQTITNVIADHLALGKRVLFVCDKRTALDVVQARLSALGLGHLCAVVHDSRRDEKDLYRSLREQLEGLDESPILPNVDAELLRADGELKALHAELLVYVTLTSARPSEHEESFQALLERWLTIEQKTTLKLGPIDAMPHLVLEPVARSLEELLTRGLATRYSENPWVRGIGVDLVTLLSVAPEAWKNGLDAVHLAAQALDALSAPQLPLFSNLTLQQQLAARQWFISSLAAIMQRGAQAQLAFWAPQDHAQRSQVAAAVLGLLPVATALCRTQIDPALVQATAQLPLPSMVELNAWTVSLAEYLGICDAFYAPICFSKQQSAKTVLARFGLTVDRATATRVIAFVEVLKQRRALYDWYVSVFGVVAAIPTDQTFLAVLETHQLIFQLLGQIATEPAFSPLQPTYIAYLREPRSYDALLGALKDSCTRAEHLLSFEQRLSEATVIGRAFRVELSQAIAQGHPVTPMLDLLRQWFATVEGVLRIQEGLVALPPGIQPVVRAMLLQGVAAQEGSVALEKAWLEARLQERLARAPALRNLDEERLQNAYSRYLTVTSQRQELSRKHLLYRWQRRQRERLLAVNGGRLNTAGAELKRRFVSRGEKAMRLRQAVLVGAELEGGDPLFDLRPIWMVSPEVTAQIFPRRSIFDLVVFDEASQCRLEEALPVLLRAERVVIAGDPQQLPPTRFFESVSAEEPPIEAEDSQELFEQQQAQTEDLLSAALNLSIEQAYLDVHYRSKHAALIEFSNIHFYGSRLEPLPRRPTQNAPPPPIELRFVDGVYDKRANEKEAEAVAALVKELLAQPTPPSLGIGCFNLAQRDAIVAALDQVASTDDEFAERLETARNRQGEGAFEGLFVKNLENVQGDERDHIIISTTYGPDPTGRFYRRFGPLTQVGGGRRLNVLITRARDKIHLVSSIPGDAYRSLPALDPGTKPNGGWLLLAYLAFAEQLAKNYANGGALFETDSYGPATNRTPSRLAAALSPRLEALGFRVQAPWGNAGLGTELFVYAPAQSGASRGIQCDFPGYVRATDPVEWEMFRQSVLTRQGFEFTRLLSPRLFRDVNGELQKLGATLTAAKA